jgi:signal transduction histidine kinase
VVVCRKPSPTVPDRARAFAVHHGPGIAAVAVVWALVAFTNGRLPTSHAVALFAAAAGSGGLAGGFGPAVTAAGVALPAGWLLGLPLDLSFVGVLALGALLLGVTGERLQRSRRRAGALADELAVTQRRLADEGEGHRRAAAERETLLHEAERARAEAESASRAKDEFLAVLSHGLRTPLQGVLGWVSLLRDGRLDAAQQGRALQAIEHSTRLHTRLVNDLLDVSCIISGELTVESRPLDLSAAVREAIDQLRPRAAARGVTLDASVAECGVTLGDPERLHQVLDNLLSNALTFTPPGGTVSVRCERDGRDVVIVVEDTGEGIAAEFLPRLFERFQQADSSISRYHGGLGLGLAIARRVVELHGGCITADSAGVGRGATFTVRLPVREPEHPGSAPSPWSAPGALSGRHILVVEDDADSREAIALALSLEGASVESAGSVHEALGRLGSTRFEAVVSDLSMPGADGFMLLEQLRAHGVEAPAIAVSGFATPEDRARALAAGFSVHMAKPIDVEVLLRTVSHLVGG